MQTPIKVLIVDDSETIRRLLTEIMSSDSGLHVVGAAVDPYEARELIKELNPDVITLDIEMPRMDGITFLRNLMRLRPMPVVMISTLTEKGAEVTMEALELGAIDYVPKPRFDVEGKLPTQTAEIILKVKHAARANVRALEHNVNQQQFSQPIDPLPADAPNKRVELIAIGASTGGTEAIKEVLRTLPPQMPPIVIVQHMPAGFTASFAKRLDSLVDLDVEELNASTQLLVGHVYLAQGGEHMLVSRRGSNFYGGCDDGPEVNRHKPSVDYLFNSVADACGAKAIGIILTGMGIDGAAGMSKMKLQGAATVAQDEASSVVWGMPRIAVQQGAVDEVLPLSAIGQHLVNLCY